MKSMKLVMGLLVFGTLSCGIVAFDGKDAGVECETAKDCPQPTIENQSCGVDQCIHSICVHEQVDAGHECPLVDPQSGKIIPGHCTEEGICIN